MRARPRPHDRKKDVIISGGENLYPVQIEDFLRSNPAIKDAAVIGLPDERLGEIAAAIIELKEGAQTTEDDIAAFCMDLPRYKRPRKIVFDTVPRNPTGKIEKRITVRHRNKSAPFQERFLLFAGNAAHLRAKPDRPTR